MKPKQNLRALSLSLLFLMTACQVEDNPTFTTKPSDNSKKVNFKTIESLFQDKNFKSSFEKIVPKNKISQIGKTIMEDEYDFTIVDQPASIVDTDSITAYTLLIDEKTKETPESISNLVIQTNNYTHVTKATILRYISNTPIINIDKFQGEMKYQPINYNPGSISPTGKLFYGCLEITTYTCTNPEATHEPGGVGCWAQPHIESICGYYDDGSNNNPSGGGGIPAPGGGSTSGGGGGSTGGVTTSPVGNSYLYVPIPKNGGNYLNLSSPQIVWLNAQSIILRKMILSFDPESNPDTTLYASDVITFLMQNSQAGTIVGINNYLLQNGITSPSLNFVDWAINYLIQNPNVTFTQFQNWFMGSSEGPDGNYDSTFWDNPNLTFPQQALPTLINFMNAYPKRADGVTFMTGAELFPLVGGQVYSEYLAHPSVVRGACALKVSRALNYCTGITIPNVPGTLLGGDNLYYFVNAKALNKWMRKTFGTNPATSSTPYNANHHHFTASQGGVRGENFPVLLAGIKGIYSMVAPAAIEHSWASGHADLIYNSTCAAATNCHFYDPVNHFVPVDYIDVWELP